MIPPLFIFTTNTMILEIRDEVLKQLKTNYALVRDEDGEVLCLL
jgi:hypothetical protein